MSTFTTAPIFLPLTPDRMSHCATLIALPTGYALARSRYTRASYGRRASSRMSSSPATG